MQTLTATSADSGIPRSLTAFLGPDALLLISRINHTQAALLLPTNRHHPPLLPSMQQPTLTNVRIRSTRDALQIFYAVARNLLPIISRRLDAEERRAIVPGNVYVWEERCANAEATGLGMERW